MRLYHLAATGLATALLASSCTSVIPPGANPQDMSAAQHRERARVEDEKASGHEAQFDPTEERKLVTASAQDSFSGYRWIQRHGHVSALRQRRVDRGERGRPDRAEGE